MSHSTPVAGVLATTLILGISATGAVPTSAPYHSPPSPAGVLTIWGPRAMSAVVTLWAAGFHRLHPEITVVPHLMGSDTAIPGLYSGLADIALLGRQDDQTDRNGFSRPKGYPFKRFELMNGSLETQGQSAALAVLVNRENPIARVTLDQLARIAGCDGVGESNAAGTWEALGAGASWANKPVHLYVFDISSGTGTFFVHTVLRDSRRIDWGRVRDFHDLRRADGTLDTAAEQIAAAIRKDPYGIGVTTVRYAGNGLKLLAIAVRGDRPFVLPSSATIIARTYPLARRTYAFIDQAPGQPISPKVKAFLTYALGPEGQADVARAGGYLPLDRATILEQTGKLE